MRLRRQPSDESLNLQQIASRTRLGTAVPAGTGWAQQQELGMGNLVLDRAEWRQAAACRTTDPGLFFPIGTTGPALEQIAAAKAVCFDCAVRDDCLVFALSTNQDSGVWGGTSEEERRQIRRARRASERAARDALLAS